MGGRDELRVYLARPFFGVYGVSVRAWCLTPLYQGGKTGNEGVEYMDSLPIRQTILSCQHIQAPLGPMYRRLYSSGRTGAVHCHM
jgi:hypothetical protein